MRPAVHWERRLTYLPMPAGAGQGQHAGLAGRVQRSEELASHVAGLIADFAT